MLDIKNEWLFTVDYDMMVQTQWFSTVYNKYHTLCPKSIVDMTMLNIWRVVIMIVNAIGPNLLIV
jgi:hypothetical protein